MFQIHDYTILDHLTEACEVVDFCFRYIYVNEAAAKREHISRDKIPGCTILELHPSIANTTLFSHLKKCLKERRSIEFEDDLSYPNSVITKWKIKIDPVPEGAFVHSIGLSPHKTKVKIRQKASSTTITDKNSQNQENILLSYDSIIKEQSKVLEIEGWLDALDVRTKETNEHIIRVTDATVILARMAGITEDEIIKIKRGALLHDIGKTGIPDTILLKADKLTVEEWDVIRKHPIYAHDLFYPIDYLRDCLPIPYSHHEKWDGTGYPQGLKGEQIPLSARLFAVIDVWDTLSFDRVYRKAWRHKEIIEYIQQQSGIQFDPDIVNLFFRAKEDLTRFSLR